MFIDFCIMKVRKDEMEDEVAPYFKREITPKVLITTTDRPSNVSCSCAVAREQYIYSETCHSVVVLAKL